MRAWLLQEGVELEERDFFKDRFSDKEFRDLIGDLQPSELFSWNSPSFRKLGLDRASLGDEELMTMMLEEPRLIRRPLVLVDGRLIYGRDTEALLEALF